MNKCFFCGSYTKNNENKIGIIRCDKCIKERRMSVPRTEEDWKLENNIKRYEDRTLFYRFEE